MPSTRYTPPADSVDEYVAAIRREGVTDAEVVAEIAMTCSKVARDFPIRVGMSVQELDALVHAVTNASGYTFELWWIDALTGTAQTVGISLGEIAGSSAADGYPEHRTPAAGSRSYMVTVDTAGWRWICVDLAIESNRVRNIYVICCTAEVMILPGMKLEGDGPHVGYWAEYARWWEAYYKWRKEHH